MHLRIYDSFVCLVGLQRSFFISFEKIIDIAIKEMLDSDKNRSISILHLQLIKKYISHIKHNDWRRLINIAVTAIQDANLKLQPFGFDLISRIITEGYGINEARKIVENAIQDPDILIQEMGRKLSKRLEKL